MPKWNKGENIETCEDEWIYLFKEGETISEKGLPSFIKKPIMREVMSIIEGFSEKEKNYHIYQSRVNAARYYNTLVDDRDQAIKERDQAFRRLEQERKNAEQERKKIEKMQKILKKQGIDFDSLNY